MRTLLAIITIICLTAASWHVQTIQYAIYRSGDPIPVSDPIAQRGDEYKKYLSPSVRIRVPGAADSGTICYFDPEKKLAYVISCGHLWPAGIGRGGNCAVDVYYHDTKLEKLEAYQANVVFYSYVRGADYSLITFSPSYKPTYFSIAPLDYVINPGQELHSCGCDHASEPAHYAVEVVGMRGADLVTRFNSPRPGRSGGGLLTDDGLLIGICWGTSDTSGNGIGMFTPLSAIHAGFTKNGYGWLCSIEFDGLARQIPIRPTGKYPDDFIPLPR